MHFLLGCGSPDWEPAWMDPYYNPPGTITDMAATIANLELMVSWLQDGNPEQGIEALASNDTLVVTTFGHGGRWSSGGPEHHSALWMADPDSCWKFHYKQNLWDTVYTQLFDQLDCF